MHTILLSYIDPGLISVAVQAIFVMVFGTLAAYTLAPWRYIKSLFSRKPESETSSEPVSQADQADAQN